MEYHEAWDLFQIISRTFRVQWSRFGKRLATAAVVSTSRDVGKSSKYCFSKMSIASLFYPAGLPAGRGAGCAARRPGQRETGVGL